MKKPEIYIDFNGKKFKEGDRVYLKYVNLEGVCYWIHCIIDNIFYVTGKVKVTLLNGLAKTDISRTLQPKNILIVKYRRPLGYGPFSERKANLKNDKKYSPFNENNYINTGESDVSIKAENLEISPCDDSKEMDFSSFVFAGKNRQEAYDSHIEFEKGFDPECSYADMTFEEFCDELDKGYDGSDCLQIARLYEDANGNIWYDNEFVR